MIKGYRKKKTSSYTLKKRLTHIFCEVFIVKNKLNRKINKLRTQLNKLTEIYALSDERILMKSKELDKLIAQYMLK